MTDYVITNGRSSAYPVAHYGAHFTGARATFCIDPDFAGLNSNVLAIPNLPIASISTSPIMVGEEFFGIHVNKRINDALTGVTAKTVRSHDMQSQTSMWKGIETSAGVFNWANIDAWVNTHYAAGRDLVFVLFGTPTFYSARPTEQGAYGAGALGAQAEPSDMTKWSTFCTTLATRYLGKIKYYEIWNEPNYFNDGTGLMRKDFYGGPVDATISQFFFFSGTFAKLSEMVRRANQAIKAVDPTAKIICPAVQGWATTSNASNTYFNGMMAAATGDGSTTMKDWIDIVGTHLYLPSSNRTQDLPGVIDQVNACKVTSGVAGLPTWDTESAPIGPDASLLSDANFNRILVRAWLTMAGKGIARTIYYQYDQGTMGIATRPGIISSLPALRTLLTGGTLLTISRFTDGRVICLTPSGLITI